MGWIAALGGWLYNDLAKKADGWRGVFRIARLLMFTIYQVTSRRLFRLSSRYVHRDSLGTCWW